MRRFIFIVEFLKRTYHFNIDAFNIKEAINVWYRKLNINEIYGIGKKSYKELIDEINNDEYFPVELDGLKFSWFTVYSTLKKGGFMYLNIFELINDINSRYFSFLLSFDGGTYISQYEGLDIHYALRIWIDNELNKYMNENIILNKTQIDTINFKIQSYLENHIKNNKLSNNNYFITIELNDNNPINKHDNKLFIIGNQC